MFYAILFKVRFGLFWPNLVGEEFMWNNLMAVSDTLEEANDTMLKLYNA